MAQRKVQEMGRVQTEFRPQRSLLMFCSREFKVPMSALTRNADTQASLQEQFDRHKCEREDAKQASAEP